MTRKTRKTTVDFWSVIIGGSPQARLRWPTRVYAHKRSARRRASLIHQAGDLGVATIWIVGECA